MRRNDGGKSWEWKGSMRRMEGVKGKNGKSQEMALKG
jgi:hypothetical protein